jgi:uncharacterized RDD family membrane protein YckC
VSTRSDGHWPGQRLGLPEEGVGSVATFGARLGAVLVDLVVAALLRGLIRLFVDDPGRVLWHGAGFGALVLMYAVLLPTTGQTFGMRLARIRVGALAGGLLGPLPALVRGVLVVLVVPALFTDRDGRGLHEKAVRSVVVRT